MSCKRVVLFYENHTEKEPAEAIKNLRSLLKTIGIKSYCFEEPKDRDRDSVLKVFKEQVAYMSSILSEKVTFDSEGIQNILAISSVQDSVSTYSSEQVKAKFVKDAIKLCGNMISSINESIAIVEHANNVDFQFCAMDMATEAKSVLEARSDINTMEKVEIRSTVMANHILKQCKQGGVLALVGASHFKIATLLREQGLNVKEYYIAKHAESPQVDDIGDHCMLGKRSSENLYCQNHHLNGLVIDLFHYPDLNATQLVAEDLSAWHTANDN